MDDIYSWPSLDMNQNQNHDFAIRRFGPARMEQEQYGDFQEAVLFDDVEQYCCASEVTGSTPCLSSSEVNDFVDSFINLDQYDTNLNHTKESSEMQQDTRDFQDDIEAYSTMLGVFEDVPIMMESDDQFGGNGDSEINRTMDDDSQGTDQGLRLVHMLLACAEAVGCRDIQLADTILSNIWMLSNPCGDSLQRVSYCFATGLRCRLSKLHQNVNVPSDIDASVITREEKIEGFRLLYQTTPYISVGFMAANEAICQAAQGKSSLHIIDLGMEHTLQWPSLIRSLASRPEGPPRLRITGLTTVDNVLDLESSMKTLKEEAKSSGIAMEFHIISEPVTPVLLTIERLSLREGETLLVNSIMNLHKYVRESRGSLKAILQAIKKLGPTALTVVEQDANHNGPFFLGRFLESLHYYSALFDSLEASLPRNSPQRLKIERLRFAEEICDIVANEGPERIERHERVDQWRRQLGRAGFQVMALKCLSQARMMLSVYGCHGYTLESDKGCLLLGWKGRPIMLASAWRCTM